MDIIRYHNLPFNRTLLGAWAEHHGARPWPVRRIAARYHLPICLATTIVEILGMGGQRND